MIECSNVFLQIGKKSILKSINFSAASNLVILGENGAGKSSLAKIMCGLYGTNFNIAVNTIAIGSLSHKQRAKLINYVSSSLEIFDDDLSVFDFILAGYYVHLKEHTDKEAQKAIEILEYFKITHLKDESIGTLSSGEKQLVAISQAILQNSFVTIFDEPTANCDAEKSIKIYKMLQSDAFLKQKIVLTHDLNFAKALKFDVLYIKNGTNLLLTPSADFFNHSNFKALFKEHITLQTNYAVTNYEAF